MHSLAPQAGIDVSKDSLDVCLSGGKPFRVPNSAEGFEALLARLPVGCRVSLEASGGYERAVRRRLSAAGFSVRTFNPLNVRRLAQAKARGGKTDALDARHLSTIDDSIPSQESKSESREELCDLSRTIEDLKSSASRLKVRAGAPGLAPAAERALRRSAEALEEQAEELEEEFLRRLKGSGLHERHRLAKTVPGAGARLARVLASELPEDLSVYAPAQLASYAGLAPMDDQSGRTRKASRIGRGNSRIKAALYMPALACIRTQSWARELYARLRGKGRAHQQAAVAVMRRLLIRIVAVLKRGSPWQAEPQKT